MKRVWVVVVAVLLVLSVGIVPAGERGVRTRLGAIVGPVEAGLYFKIPLIEHIEKIDVRTRVIANEHYENERGDVISDNALSAASRDLQDVNISSVVNYRIDNTRVEDIFRQYRTVRNFEEGVIKPLIKETVKATAAQYTAEELVTKRAEFSDKASALLKVALESKSAFLERLNITNIEFSASFTAAIEAKVTAEQQALAAKNKLEQVKFEAEQRVTQAKAEAEAIRIQAQAITQQGGRDYVQLKAIEKWNGILPENLYGSAPIPFLNIGN